MKYLRGFLMAWGNFSALPCPYHRWHEESRKAMLSMLPLVGLLLGVVVAVVWMVLNRIGVPAVLTGPLVAATYFCCNGFIHLDGFMDCNDAILSRRPELSERQRILKASDVGAFAVITVVLMFLVFAAAMAAMAEAVSFWSCLFFPGMAVVSRAVAADAVLGKPSMGSSQYANLEKARGGGWFRDVVFLWAAALIPLLLLFSLLAWGVRQGDEVAGTMAGALAAYIGAVAAAAVTAHIMGFHARKQLGGMNGDIAGYMIVSGELAGVIGAAILASLVG